MHKPSLLDRLTNFFDRWLDDIEHRFDKWHKDMESRCEKENPDVPEELRKAIEEDLLKALGLNSEINNPYRFL
jgi:hypothetical protein